MSEKTITARKISTGGILVVKARSFTAMVKDKGLDPTDWEEVKQAKESEVDETGDNN